MKKGMLALLLVLLVILSGCNFIKDAASEISKRGKEETEETNNQELEAEKNSGGIGEADVTSSDDVQDLKLQIQKADKEAGITVENSELYSYLDEVVKADPKGGIPNDFSLFPNDIVANEDGSSSILFIAVNRLRAPIKSIYFDLTLGIKDGGYIFENEPVLLDEEYIGVIEKDSAIPFLIEINQADEALFTELTEENINMQIDNPDIEFEK
ncbi:hypothetical protein [Paraliobacillus sp. JSM ZJ581]|uniref:hypothetical protein n=1 Tax=Paraliobacillus sp. JSM ZJ581 TaxID=3342118 RepID=UPI0035A9736D